MQNIQRTLENLGLDKKESSIYLTCLQFGAVTATTLARITNIPRTSLYDIIPRLVKKGFIHTTKKQKTTLFSAVDPNKIIHMLQAQQQKILDQIHDVENIIPEFKSMQSFVGTVPTVEYYEGRESLDMFFEQIANAEYSYSIFSLDDLLKHIFFNVDELLKHLSHPDIQGAQRIMTYSPNAIDYKKKAEKINPHIKWKILPQGYELSAEITLFEGTLLQMSFGDPKPSILEMKHPIYYDAHKTLFDYIWNSID